MIMGKVSGTPAGAAPYTFLCELAHGGMGCVELVPRRKGRFERTCARKRLFPHLRGGRALPGAG
jgi:hypothetical protein